MTFRWPFLIAKRFSLGALTSMFLLQSIILYPGCASSSPSKVEEKRISDLELQDEIQRFVTQFLERMNQAMFNFQEVKDPLIKSTGAHHTLRLASAALDIATGPRPEVNLLDMMVFMKLNRELLEEYWIPKFYGKKGQDLLAAFDDSERDLSYITDDRVSPQQMKVFNQLVDSWRKENPELIYVEGVRLTDFSHRVGKLETDRSQEVGGLVSGIKSAVSTADQAMLLANRALFLGKRMPFLLRLQARIGANEILTDSLKQFPNVGPITANSRLLAQDLSGVLVQVNEAMKQAGPLLRDFREFYPYNANSTMEQKLTTAHETVIELRRLLDDFNKTSPASLEKGATEVKTQIKDLIWEFAFALTLAGLLITFFWWLGYYLVKRKVSARS